MEADAEARAWEVYNAHSEWVARVDTKASILLTLQGVALGVVISLTDEHKPLSWTKLEVEPVRVALFFVGLVLLAVAILFALAVIVPQVGRWKGKERPQDYIYFGHSRLWKGADLATALRKPAVRAVADQIIILGGIAWIKNRNAKWSAWTFVAGGALLCALVAFINLSGA